MGRARVHKGRRRSRILIYPFRIRRTHSGSICQIARWPFVSLLGPCCQDKCDSKGCLIVGRRSSPTNNSSLTSSPVFQWLLVVSIAVLYNIIFVIGRAVFWEINNHAKGLWWTLDYLCDFIYMIDTLVHCHEGEWKEFLGNSLDSLHSAGHGHPGKVPWTLDEVVTVSVAWYIDNVFIGYCFCLSCGGELDISSI